MASQKIAGRNVTVDQHASSGTVVNVDRKRATPGGGCGNPSIDMEEVELNTQCFPNGFCDECVVALHYIDLGLNHARTDPNCIILSDWCDPNPPPTGSDFLYEFQLFPRDYKVRWEGFHFSEGCGSHLGCDGPVGNTDDLPAPVIIAKIGSTWYIQSYISGVSLGPFIVPELFYAETTDISSPVANSLTAWSTTCDPYTRSSVLMDIWWGDCTPGSGDIQCLALAKNGTVAVTP